MSTKQDRAISAANTLISLISNFASLRQGINDFVARNASENYSSIWSNLATATQNMDGSLGPADKIPISTHPIDNRVATQSGLSYACTETQLAAGITLIQDFQKFLTNQPVSIFQRSQIVDDIVS